MINKELVTVIIPAYNTEKYIEKCLDSLLQQSYPEIEVIMIDDGSKDKTGDICKKYAAQDNRFRLIQKKNTGVSDSRNVGIQEAKGKYLVFVDSDDYVAVDYIETLVEEMENVQLVCAEYFLVKEKQEYPHTTELERTEQKTLKAKDAINMLHREVAFQGYLWNKIFLREVIVKEKIYFDPRVKIWEDMLFCLKYLTKIECIKYVGKPIYYYVQRDNSAVHDDSIWKEHTQLVALDEMWKIVETWEGAFCEHVRDSYVNSLAGVLGKESFQDDDAIASVLKMIKSMEGHLSLKHKIKVLLFEFTEILRRRFSR